MPYEEHMRDSPKLNVWCALSYERLVGQFLVNVMVHFFHEQTVNSDIYLDFLENFAFPLLQDLQSNLIFELDDAQPHWKLCDRQFLDHSWNFSPFSIDWEWRSNKLHDPWTRHHVRVWGFVKHPVKSLQC